MTPNPSQYSSKTTICDACGRAIDSNEGFSFYPMCKRIYHHQCDPLKQKKSDPSKEIKPPEVPV